MVSYPGQINGPLSVSGDTALAGKLSVAGLTTLGKVVETGDFFQLSSSPAFTLAAQTATPITLALAAGATYLMDTAAIIANAAGISTISWTGPAGATMQWNDTTTSTDYAATIGATNAYAASASTRMALLRGLLVVAATAGNLTMTLGVSAGTTTLSAGSFLRLTRVA